MALNYEGGYESGFTQFTRGDDDVRRMRLNHALGAVPNTLTDDMAMYRKGWNDAVIDAALEIGMLESDPRASE